MTHGSHEQILNWIDNKFQDYPEPRFFKKYSPIDNTLIGHVIRSNSSSVQQAINAAKVAFPSWSNSSSVHRGETVYAIAEGLHRHRERIAQIIRLETGKSLKDADGEISGAIAQARFMAGEGSRMGGRSIPSVSENKKVMTVREPVGVCALLVSFNTPIANIAWKVFPALICGNTVVLKSSEESPLVAAIFGEICAEMGLPPGVLNIVHGLGEECGKPLVIDPNIALISFTGSTKVGRKILQQLDGSLTKVFLELGGKNPLVICEDADLPNALKWALLSSFSNAGQRCASSSRILVEASIYQEFKDEFVKRTRELNVGSEDSDEVGPVISLNQVANLESWCQKAIADGGTILTGGSKYSGSGNYFAPTIIQTNNHKSDLANIEFFGPITMLSSFANLEEAIDLANSSSYGLTAAIHTKSINKAFYFCSQMKSGVTSINGGTHGSEPHFPFGGVKDSGNGFREPGTEALEIYSNWKNIIINY